MPYTFLFAFYRLSDIIYVQISIFFTKTTCSLSLLLILLLKNLTAIIKETTATTKIPYNA